MNVNVNEIKPATSPRSTKDHRVLVIDGISGETKIVSAIAIADAFEPGDLIIVNDAATLPASFHGEVDADAAAAAPLELRLVAHISDCRTSRAGTKWRRGGDAASSPRHVRQPERTSRAGTKWRRGGDAASSPRHVRQPERWTVALLGRGDWHTKTEDREPPPPLAVGAVIRIGTDGLRATVTHVHAVSSRLVDVDLSIAASSEASTAAAIWAAMYRAGRPVQYAHVSEALALWDVQNVYAGRPWAVEMPSAGKMIRASTILELEARGVEIARVTHAAGLSSIGDATVDAMLPLPERFEVREETWEAIARARRRGGRVIALGTSAARALEGGVRAGGARTGITDFRLGPNTRRAVVDAIVTGVHDAGTSHHTLLGAFASAEILERALAIAAEAGLLGHELGDACLVWGEPREKVLSLSGEPVDNSRRTGIPSSRSNAGAHHAAA